MASGAKVVWPIPDLINSTRAMRSQPASANRLSVFCQNLAGNGAVGQRPQRRWSDQAPWFPRVVPASSHLHVIRWQGALKHI